MSTYQPPLPAADAGRQTLNGIILIVLTLLLFASQDAITKHLAQLYPVPFFIMIRYWAFSAFGIALARWRAGSFRAAIRSNAPFLQIFRALLLVTEMGIFALSLRYLKLVESHALFACFPLMATLLAIPVLGEKVGWRRSLAVAAGFLGVLVILRPGLGVFQMAGLISLTAAFGFGLYHVLTRLVSRYDTPATSMLYMGLVGGIAVSLVGPFFWAEPSLADWGWIALLCLTGTAGHYMLIKALEFAEATTLQPFNYLHLVFAAIIGFLVFAELPDAFTVAGGGIVVASGLYVIWRERRR